MTSIVMRVAVATSNLLQSKGVTMQPEVAAQLLASGVVGPGVSRLEEAIRLKLPFVLDPASYERRHQLGRWDHQFHRGLMIERAKKAMRRAHERAQPQETLDDITLDFKAQQIVTYVMEQAVQHGLTVYTQKLAFDPIYPREVKQQVLAGMAQADFGPVTATAAAAVGILPRPPMATVTDAIRHLASMDRIVGLGGTLAKWVVERSPYLVEFPAPDLEAGRMARQDYFTPHQHYSELGLGFILVGQEEFRSQYHVITPMLFTRRHTNRPTAPITYNTECQRQLYPLSKVPFIDLNRPHEQLTRVLRDPNRNRVFRMDVCKHCGTVFAHGHADLAHTRCTIMERT